MVIKAAEQTYTQTTEFRYLGSCAREHGELNAGDQLLEQSPVGVCPGVLTGALRQAGSTAEKVRLLEADAMEARLYGCMTWALRRGPKQLLKRMHHRLRV